MLFGYDERNRRETVRGHRVFCSNRGKRPGCGRTFSVWRADVIRRLSLTAACLWGFLQRAVGGTIAAAASAAECHRSDRTMQRVWKRFDLAQTAIRTALRGLCPPPERPAESAKRPAAAQVFAHLQAAFPGAGCPIAAFQHALRAFFI